jgi:hypothetical protein
MGQTKGNGYQQMQTLTPEQQSLLQSITGSAQGNQNQAANAFSQFLPGGKGGEAITNAAQQQFKQTTIPSIMNAFGSNAKSSSALNQALAAGGSNLNSNIASQLAQMQLQAAGGLGGIGQSQASTGLGTAGFGLTPQQSPLWQKLLGLIAGGAGGTLSGAATGGPLGAVGGGLQGAAQGFGAI